MELQRTLSTWTGSEEVTNDGKKGAPDTETKGVMRGRDIHPEYTEYLFLYLSIPTDLRLEKWGL